MSIKDKLKIDDTICKTLDLKRISRLICNTDKGVIELTIRKGESTYFLTLDSVPLTKEDNKVLMDLLFPAPKPQEVPKVQKESQLTWNGEPISPDSKEAKILKALDPNVKPKKKLGRPKGSKDGVKME